jgi:RNase adapter protein RapZ
MPGRVVISSFGYLHPGVDVITATADVVVDLREHFRDPHIDPALRELNGHHGVVRDKVLATAGVREFVRGLATAIWAILEHSERTVYVALGCAGGRHRSVVIADSTVQYLIEYGYLAEAKHLHIDRPVVTR